MQTIIITGRVGGDAETRTAGSGQVTNFNCAVDQGWGNDKTTNWYRCAIWGERGSKLAQYIKKGDKVAVTGELVIGEYKGAPQYEIRVADIDCFMAGKSDGAGSSARPAPGGGVQRPEPADFGTDLDDDVPFISSDPALDFRI